MSQGIAWPAARIECLRGVYPTEATMSEVIQRVAEAAPEFPAPSRHSVLSQATRLGLKRPSVAKGGVAADLTGQVFGHLTALRRTGRKDASGAHLWACQCACGNSREAPPTPLRRGLITRCVPCAQKNAGKVRTQNLLAIRSARIVWTEERLAVLRQSVTAGDTRAVTHQKVCAASPEVRHPSLSSLSARITDLGLADARPANRPAAPSILWPAERLTLMRDLWQRPGLAMAEIVAALAASVPQFPAPQISSVYLQAKKMGLGSRPQAQVKNTPKKAAAPSGKPFPTTIWTPERRAALPALWAEGLPLPEIRARLAAISPDLPPPTESGVMDKIYRMKLPLRPRVQAVQLPRPPRPPRPARIAAPKPPKPEKPPLWGPEQIRLVREMRLAGKSFPEIGREVGRSKDSVAALCRKIEVKPEVPVRQGRQPKPVVTVVVTRVAAAEKAKELLGQLFDRYPDRRKLEAKLDEEILEISKRSGMLAATWHRYGRQPEMIPRAGREAMREVRALIGQVRMERYSREISE